MSQTDAFCCTVLHRDIRCTLGPNASPPQLRPTRWGSWIAYNAFSGSHKSAPCPSTSCMSAKSFVDLQDNPGSSPGSRTWQEHFGTESCAAVHIFPL